MWEMMADASPEMDCRHKHRKATLHHAQWFGSWHLLVCGMRGRLAWLQQQLLSSRWALLVVTDAAGKCLQGLAAAMAAHVSMRIAEGD